MQFYQSSFPSENEVVAIRITHIHEYGVEALLLEYANAPRGIIFNKDLSRKRIRSIKDVVRIGQETVATVMNISPNSIDLSIRNCNQDDMEIMKHYGRHKTVHNLLVSIAHNQSDSDATLQTLYETVVWPIAAMELDVYDTFLQLHTEAPWVLETPYLEDLRKFVKLRMPLLSVTKHRDLSLTSMDSFYAPEILTHALSAALCEGCEVFIIAPPTYRIQVTRANEEEANETLDAVESSLRSYLATNRNEEESVGSVGCSYIPEDTNMVLDLAEIAHKQATMNLGTLGNVSEGKSTLVRALSKIATQRHKKEKLLNITIHLGYSGFKLWRNTSTGDLISSTSATKSMDGAELLGHYSFADCPGHEAYLATMLSGAAIMDAAALLIAANSPTIPQMQTQEHLIAAEIMNLPHIFVLQNKLDAMESAAIQPSYERIRAFVKGTSAESSPIIPLSAQREWGLEHVLHHIAYNIPPPSRTFTGGIRMQLVRSFDINRPCKWSENSSVKGGVLGGTLQRGVLHPGDLLEIRPGLFVDGEAVPVLTRVGSLHCDSELLPFAIAGGLIGVGTSLDPALTVANAFAGHVAGTPGTLPDISVKLKGRFRSFDRSGGTAASDAATAATTTAFKFKKHKEGDKIRFCVGSMTVTGRISKVGDHGKRAITLDRPVCVEVGQTCSILRSNGSRELLDGILVVEAVKPFKHVRAWDPAVLDLASKHRDCVLARSYTVLPNTRIHDAPPLPPYECMLDTIETHVNALTAPITLKLPPPIIQRLPKKTAWVNTAETLAVLQARTPVKENAVCLATHFQTYLMEELCTTLTVKKEGQYILAGRFTEANCRTLLRKYMVKYHKCQQCGSCTTCLVRQDRSLRLYCEDCTSSAFILS